MSETFGALQGLRSSTADLLQGLEGLAWSDADVAAPSLCAGWTRGHVLTHLARNADGITATLAGALRGEVVPRYPEGPAGRDRDIEKGADRPFAELAADVRDSAQRLDRVLGAVHDAGAWDRPTAEEKPARHWLTARWKEVEIHRVDLDAGYGPQQWPPALVALLLPAAADTLTERAAGPLRVAVTAEDSLLPDFVGREWCVGDGRPVEVSGPDWAVLAWLVGRPTAVAAALTAAPELRPFQ
jgi:maleylpyruvate isomerase